MDAALDRMLDLMAADEPIEEPIDIVDNIKEDIDYINNLGEIEEQIKQLVPLKTLIETRPGTIDAVEFDPQYNILDPIIKREFRDECVFEETEIFTSPISTTNTMEGYLSNVSFHEAELINDLIPNSQIVMIKCNYGKLLYDFYREPVKQRKTNRGRKKKEKTKKLRKKQGTGSDFNSQITFVVKSSLEEDTDIVSPDAKVYKFKVFRTGKLQLPGVKPHLIDDIIVCTKEIVNMLNYHLHFGEHDPSKLTSVVNINPVMKNYKFIAKLAAGSIIDLNVLKRILVKEKTDQFVRVDDDGVPQHSPIFMIKYTRLDTKLSIKFSTPIYKKPKKKTRINIFMRGKINILGAFDTATTRDICNYLHWVFEQNYNTLIVREGTIANECEIVDNVYHESIEESIKTAEVFRDWLPDMPNINDKDANSIIDYFSQAYDCVYNYVNNYIEGLLNEIPPE